MPAIDRPIDGRSYLAEGSGVRIVDRRRHWGDGDRNAPARVNVRNGIARWRLFKAAATRGAGPFRMAECAGSKAVPVAEPRVPVAPLGGTDARAFGYQRVLASATFTKI